jgi:transposase
MDAASKPMSSNSSPPSWSQGDIVIMDNLGSHKATVIRKMIHGAGARLWFLPPYSPYLNPIEQAFAKIKHWMRMARRRTIEDTWRQVGHLVDTINPQSGRTTSLTPDMLPSKNEGL